MKNLVGSTLTWQAALDNFSYKHSIKLPQYGGLSRVSEVRKINEASLFSLRQKTVEKLSVFD